MLSILGAIVGLLGSFIPKILDFLKAKEDHKHELAVLKVQAEMAKSEHLYRLEEVNAAADIASEQAVYKQAEIKYTGVKWIDAILALYSGTIRPTITYLFMGSYMFVKYAQIKMLTASGGDLWTIVWKLWNSDDMAAFMCILGFWFGGRMLKHTMGVYGVGNNNHFIQPTLAPAKPEEKPVAIPKPEPEKPRPTPTLPPPVIIN